MVITPLFQTGSQCLRLCKLYFCLSALIQKHKPWSTSNHQIPSASVLEIKMQRGIISEKLCWRKYEYMWQTQAELAQRINMKVAVFPFLSGLPVFGFRTFKMNALGFFCM